MMISIVFNVSKCAQNIKQNTLPKVSGSGGPRKTTDKEDEEIVQLHKQEMFRFSIKTAYDMNISEWTVSY